MHDLDFTNVLDLRQTITNRNAEGCQTIPAFLLMFLILEEGVRDRNIGGL